MILLALPFLALTLAQEVVPPPQAHGVCMGLSEARDKLRAAKWTELTDRQWEFMRGIFVMNPETPKGLPFGDTAYLLQAPGDDGGVVIFVDKDMACTPMPIPKEMVEMLMKVGSGDVVHEGGDM